MKIINCLIQHPTQIGRKRHLVSQQIVKRLKWLFYFLLMIQMPMFHYTLTQFILITKGVVILMMMLTVMAFQTT